MPGNRGLALCALLALGSCTSYDAPPEPPVAPTTPNSIAGYVTNGSFGFGDTPVATKGAHGYGYSGTTDSAGRFVMETTGLSMPLIVEASGLYAVAPAGLTYMNVTPFTTMQVMVLGANDPYAFFNFVVVPSGRDGVPDMVRMTPIAVAAAQSTVVEVMKEDASFAYEPDTMSFVATRFKANNTDLMAVMLNNFNNTYGDPSAFAPLLIPEGKRCRAERVFAITPQHTRQFCPALKSNLPDDGHPLVTVYGATNARSDSLQVRVQGSAIVSVTYTRHDEEQPYRCTGTACVGVTLGPVNAEQKRTVTFRDVRVAQGTGMTASLEGTMLTNDPGPLRPPALECAEGLTRVTASFEDGNLRQGCQSPGAYGTPIYDGILAAQFDPYDDDGNGFSVVVRTSGAQVLSVAMQDPNTGALYYCRAPACGPVAATAPAPDGAYEVTLDGATLAGVNQDGTPSGMPAATITASTPLMAFAGIPSESPCTYWPSYDTLQVAIDGGATVPLCVGNVNAVDRGWQAFDFGTGDTNYVAVCGFNQCVTVVAKDATVSTLFVSFAFGDNWSNAEPTFAGITILGPDGDGLLGLEFNNVGVRDIEAFGLPGVRTGRLDGRSVGIPFISFMRAGSLRARLMEAVTTAKTRRPPALPRPASSRGHAAPQAGGR